MILGIDEVGRGPWAGPLVVGAAVLPDDLVLDGLTDSKKLSTKKRIELDALIRRHATGLGLGWVHADEIDQIGLSNALRLAAIRAVESIDTPYHEIIIDGTVNFLKDTSKGRYVTTLKKADFLIPAVSAASIVAKVARDKFMADQADIYPEYGFDKHVGYGTAMHRQVIEQLGVTPIHRLSFGPLKRYAVESKKPLNTTKQIGDQAENKVCEHLISIGHKIVARNWKTKYCEIDIVSQFGDNLYFTEVKYRRSVDHGDGLAAITPKKIKQIRFAAEMFLHANNLKDISPIIQVASVSGDRFTIDHVLDIL